MLKRIALLGWTFLRQHASYSIDTVIKIDGVYFHLEVYLYDRPLFNHYIPVPSWLEKIIKDNPVEMGREPLDVNYNSKDSWDFARQQQRQIIDQIRK